MSEEVRIGVAGELVQHEPVAQLALAQHVLKALMHIRVIPVSHLQPDSLHQYNYQEMCPCSAGKLAKKSAILESSAKIGREGMEEKSS